MIDRAQILNDPHASRKFLEDWAPWRETLDAPYIWMTKNLDRYIFPKEEIISSAMSVDGLEVTQDRGVYFLIQDKQVIYVGLSNNIERRTCQHKDKGVRFTHISWITWIPDLFIDSVESFYIYEFQPPLNNKYYSLCSVLCEYAERYPEKAKLKAFYREYLTPNEICWFEPITINLPD